MDIVIISPHLDDEVLGCASFLNDAVGIIYVTDFHPLFPEGENVKENENLVSHLGAESVHFKLMTNAVSEESQANLISLLEKQINKWQPQVVLVPYPSYNQDHRAIYNASMTALRPHDRNHFVKCILLYEQPETFGIQKLNDFRPTYFRPVDMKEKIRLVKFYQTQLRGHRSFEHITSIARVRGMQSNMKYAEAFELVRLVA